MYFSHISKIQISTILCLSLHQLTSHNDIQLVQRPQSLAKLPLSSVESNIGFPNRKRKPQYCFHELVLLKLPQQGRIAFRLSSLMSKARFD